MKSFTLIELIVVIAIIAILSAIIAPNAFRAIEKAKISATISDYRAIKTAAMSYYADTGQWPRDCANFPPCSTGFVIDDGKSGWDGPYLEKWPSSARWGGVYFFRDTNGIDWSGDGVGDSARYVVITNVPLGSAQRVDRESDGVINTASGFVRYAVVNPTDLWMLISTEVPVN